MRGVKVIPPRHLLIYNKGWIHRAVIGFDFLPLRQAVSLLDMVAWFENTAEDKSSTFSYIDIIKFPPFSLHYTTVNDMFDDARDLASEVSNYNVDGDFCSDFFVSNRAYNRTRSAVRFLDFGRCHRFFPRFFLLEPS